MVAMFLPSFWTGRLIQRFSAARIVGVGLSLITFAAIIGLSGLSTWHFWSSLILVGLGWNFGFVGSSAMVLDTHRPEERSRVQSFNDFLIFRTMAAASFSSGQILANWGWEYVNWVDFPPLLLLVALMVVVGAFRADRQASAPAQAGKS